MSDAWHHYDRHGREEGRSLCDFDEKFYLSYPGVAKAIAGKQVETALRHYIVHGRGRGYLPNFKAVRPNDAAAPASRFGGLWIDAGDAPDRIKGRLETGQITQLQAKQLDFFLTNGYVILPSAVPAPAIDAAIVDFDKAFVGGFEQLKFEAPEISRENIAWRPLLTTVPVKALDIHHFSPAIRSWR